ncbi:enoyl-CoA hydratase-related protein [Yinghuangia aomiensis]
MPLVTLSHDAAVATITLDSPKNRNALSAALMDELDRVLSAVAVDTSVRAVVLTHTGPTFCAGADLREAADGGMEQGTGRLLGLLQRIVDLPVPVIAHLRGNARAGGLGLVGACDLAVAPASTTSRVLRGPPRPGTRDHLAHHAAAPGPALASRYFLTGEEFDGIEAQRIGLLTLCGEGIEGTDAAAEHLLAGLRLASRQGLTETKRLLNTALTARVADEGPGVVRLSTRTLRLRRSRRRHARAFAEHRPRAGRRRTDPGSSRRGARSGGSVRLPRGCRR